MRSIRCTLVLALILGSAGTANADWDDAPEQAHWGDPDARFFVSATDSALEADLQRHRAAFFVHALKNVFAAPDTTVSGTSPLCFRLGGGSPHCINANPDHPRINGSVYDRANFRENHPIWVVLYSGERPELGAPEGFWDEIIYVNVDERAAKDLAMDACLVAARRRPIACALTDSLARLRGPGEARLRPMPAHAPLVLDRFLAPTAEPEPTPEPTAEPEPSADSDAWTNVCTMTVPLEPEQGFRTETFGRGYSIFQSPLETDAFIVEARIEIPTVDSLGAAELDLREREASLVLGGLAAHLFERRIIRIEATLDGHELPVSTRTIERHPDEPTEIQVWADLGAALRRTHEGERTVEFRVAGRAQDTGSTRVVFEDLGTRAVGSFSEAGLPPEFLVWVPAGRSTAHGFTRPSYVIDDDVLAVPWWSESSERGGVISPRQIVTFEDDWSYELFLLVLLALCFVGVLIATRPRSACVVRFRRGARATYRDSALEAWVSRPLASGPLAAHEERDGVVLRILWTPLGRLAIANRPVWIRGSGPSGGLLRQTRVFFVTAGLLLVDERFQVLFAGAEAMTADALRAALASPDDLHHARGEAGVARDWRRKELVRGVVLWVPSSLALFAGVFALVRYVSVHSIVVSQRAGFTIASLAMLSVSLVAIRTLSRARAKRSIARAPGADGVQHA